MSGSSLRVRDLGPAKVLALFAFGAVALSFFDGFHTHSGTTRYAHEVVWQAAWWTPVIFGASVAVGGPAYAIGYARLGGTRAPPPWSSLGVALVAFGCMYYASGYAPVSNVAKLAFLAASAIVFWAWLDRTRAGAQMALVVGAVGPLAEIVQVQAGTFVHLQPDVLGIPIWLPALYIASGPIIGQGARRWLGAA